MVQEEETEGDEDVEEGEGVGDYVDYEVVGDAGGCWSGDVSDR